jgi:hypothetical protein
MGLVTGATWIEFWLTDVRLGSFESLSAAVINYG